MKKVSSSWSDGDELSFESSLEASVTRYRLLSLTRLTPSLSAEKLEVKCQIDLQFEGDCKVEEVRVLSNARNVEVYVAMESGTFEYRRTSRGEAVDGKKDRFQVSLEALEAGALRLRMLSLRGEKLACSVESLSFVLRAPHHHREDLGALEKNKPPGDKKDDLQLEHLATIGTQMLRAAEKRVVTHIDLACDKLGQRFEAAVKSQNHRLDRIEALLHQMSVSENATTGDLDDTRPPVS